MTLNYERSVKNFAFFIFSYWRSLFALSIIFSAVFFFISSSKPERFLLTSIIQIKSNDSEDIKSFIQNPRLRIADVSFQKNRNSDLQRLFIQTFRDPLFLNDFIQTHKNTLATYASKTVGDLAKQRRSFLKVASKAEGREEILLEVTSVSDDPEVGKEFQREYVQAILREMKISLFDIARESNEIANVPPHVTNMPPHGTTISTDWETEIPLVNFKAIRIMIDAHPRARNFLDKRCSVQKEVVVCQGVDIGNIIKYLDLGRLKEEIKVVNSPRELLSELARKSDQDLSDLVGLIDTVVDGAVSVSEIAQRKEGRQFDHIQQAIFGFLIGFGGGLMLISALFAQTVKET